MLQMIRVATGSGNEEGRLVLSDDRLIAVLVHLEGNSYEELAGRWYLEAGFGQLDGPHHPTFPDLSAAQDWIRTRLTHRPAGGLSRYRH